MNFNKLLSEIDDQLEVLGLTRPTTKDKITEAWRKKTLITHPDQQGNTPEAHEAMKELNLAYDFLMKIPALKLSSEPATRRRRGRQRTESQRRQRERAERERQQRERTERQRQARDFDQRITPSVDVPAILIRFGFAFGLSGIIGYGSGFRAAQATSDGFLTVIGAAVVCIPLLVIAIYVLAHLPWRRLFFWLEPRGFDNRKTVLWSSGVIGVAAILGGLAGYAAGTYTAQTVLNVLSGIGLAVIIALILLVGLLALGASDRSR